MPNIFLVDPLVCIGKPDVYVAINRQLQGYFDKVGQAMKPQAKIVVAWVPGTPMTKPEDVLVYYTSPEYSVVRRFDGTVVTTNDREGYTKWKSANGRITGAVSEVYVKIMNADMLSKLAVHEIIHNKLAVGDTIHKRGGLAAETVGPASEFTTNNINDLAGGMLNAHPQWTAGVAMMGTARIRRDVYKESDWDHDF